jgi:hypothetical protein
MVFHQIAPVGPASRLCGQYRLEARANNIEIIRQPWLPQSKNGLGPPIANLFSESSLLCGQILVDGRIAYFSLLRIYSFKRVFKLPLFEQILGESATS